MRIIMMSNHVIPSRIRLSAPGHGADVIFVPVVVGHVSVQVFLPEETSATLVAFERAVVGSRVAFFVVSIEEIGLGGVLVDWWG